MHTYRSSVVYIHLFLSPIWRQLPCIRGRSWGRGAGGICLHLLGIYLVNLWNFWKKISLFTVAPHKKFASAYPACIAARRPEGGYCCCLLRMRSQNISWTTWQDFLHWHTGANKKNYILEMRKKRKTVQDPNIVKAS